MIPRRMKIQHPIDKRWHWRSFNINVWTCSQFKKVCRNPIIWHGNDCTYHSGDFTQQKAVKISSMWCLIRYSYGGNVVLEELHQTKLQSYLSPRKSSTMWTLCNSSNAFPSTGWVIFTISTMEALSIVRHVESWLGDAAIPRRSGWQKFDQHLLSWFMQCD